MDAIPKYKIPVRVALLEEDAVFGVIYVRQEQRIIDMLCDERPFFPITTKNGMFLLNKNAVIKVEVLEEAFILQHRDNFPGLELAQDTQAAAAMAERRSRKNGV